MSIAPAISPLITLSNGKRIPQLGLGTWKSPPGQVYAAVKSALTNGYRHIDCAFVYQNQTEVGRALNEIIGHGLDRDDIFITSKIWNTCHSFDRCAENMKATLDQLGLDHVDLMLVHWPFGYQEGGDIFPTDAQGQIIGSDVDYLDTWRGLELCVERGQTKSIGVSNFSAAQVQRVLDNCSVKPVMNQVECHPYLNQKELIEWSHARGVELTAYSPLGSPDRPWAKEGDPLLMEVSDDARTRSPLSNLSNGPQEPAITAIAARHNKSPAQVLIRYQVQHNVVVIPKSVTESRIKENMNVFDFELSADDMKAIDAFNRGHRFLGLEHMVNHKYYPFHDAY